MLTFDVPNEMVLAREIMISQWIDRIELVAYVSFLPDVFRCVFGYFPGLLSNCGKQISIPTSDVARN